MATYSLPAWGGAPLSRADQMARQQAYAATQGRGGSIGQAALDDWSRLHPTDTFARTPQTQAMPTSFAPGPGAMASPAGGGQSAYSGGGSPAGGGGQNPYAAFGGIPYNGGPLGITPGTATGSGQGAYSGFSLANIANGNNAEGLGPGAPYPASPIAGKTQSQLAQEMFNPTGSSSANTGGMGSNYGSFDPGSFNFDNWKDPGYDFRLAEGNKLLEGSAAARGGLLSGSTLKDLTNYGQGAASQEYANAFNRFNTNRDFGYRQFTGDRNFGYNADVNDRDFAYKAGIDDRNFNTDADRYLSGLGLRSTEGTAQSNNQMALLQSALAQAMGSSQSAGTIGGGNAITNALSQALAQMSQNRSNSSVEDLLAQYIRP